MKSEDNLLHLEFDEIDGFLIPNEVPTQQRQFGWDAYNPTIFDGTSVQKLAYESSIAANYLKLDGSNSPITGNILFDTAVALVAYGVAVFNSNGAFTPYGASLQFPDIYNNIMTSVDNTDATIFSEFNQSSNFLTNFVKYQSKYFYSSQSAEYVQHDIYDGAGAGLLQTFILNKDGLTIGATSAVNKAVTISNTAVAASYTATLPNKIGPQTFAMMSDLMGVGTGTVTNVSGVAANGFTWSIANASTTPAITLTLQDANASQSGKLNSTDWNTFNGKQSPSTTLSGYGITNAYTIAQTDSAISAATVGLLDDRGNFTPSGNYPSTGGSGASGAILKGDLWTIAGLSGTATVGTKTVSNGDVVRALIDTPSNTDSNWAIGENNFGYTALNQSMSSGTVYVGSVGGIGTAVSISQDASLIASGTLTVTGIQGKAITLATGYLRYNGTSFAFDSNTYLTTTTAASTYLPIANPAYTGSLTTGILGYSDTGILASFQSSVAGYNQIIAQNTNSGATASVSYVVSNNAGTASTNFGEFGMNSSGFTGSGSFNLPSAVYLSATSGELVFGTTASNGIHFVVNGATTDALAINAAGTIITVGAGTVVGLQTTQNLYNTIATTVNAFGAATTLNVAGTATGAVTHTYSGAATTTGLKKTVNLATGAATGGLTDVFIGAQTGTGSKMYFGDGTIYQYNTSSATYDILFGTVGGAGQRDLCPGLAVNMLQVVIKTGGSIIGQNLQPLVLQTGNSLAGVLINKNTVNSGGVTNTSGNGFIMQLWQEANNGFNVSTGSGTLTWLKFNGELLQTGASTSGYTRLIDFTGIAYTSVAVSAIHSQIYTNIAAASNKFFINSIGTGASVHLGAFAIGSVTQPAASTILELTSTTAGLGLPIFNNTQKNALSTTRNGVLIYQSDDATGLHVVDGGRTCQLRPRVYNAISDVTINASATQISNYVSPIGKLAANGDTYEILTTGTISALGVVTFDVRLNTTSLYTFSSLTAGASGTSFTIKTVLTRRTATTIIYSIEIIAGGLTDMAAAGVATISTLASNTLTIEHYATGGAISAGTSNRSFIDLIYAA